MAWNSTNLSALMGAKALKVDDTISKLQSKITELTNSKDIITTSLATAADALQITGNALLEMNKAGLYSIALKPKQGDWYTRLSTAPVEGGGRISNLHYSCGTAMIIIVASPQAAIDQMTKLVATLESTVIDSIDDIEAFLDSDKQSTEFDNMIDILDGSLENIMNAPNNVMDKLTSGLSADTWRSLTPADVFGGAAKSLAKSTMNLKGEVTNLSQRVKSAKSKIAGFNKVLTKVNTFADNLSNTGCYSIMLPPGPGSFLGRLKSEAGAPPASSEYYTAGIAAFAAAPDLAGLAGKYAALSKVM